MPRLRLALAAYGVLLLALVWQSTPRPIGDGAEYFALARALSERRSPALTAAQVRDYTAWLNGLGEPFRRLHITQTYRPETARYEVPHFWAYSALAAPWLLATRWLGLHPNHAFTALNAVLLLIAFHAVAVRGGLLLAALMFVGPILWWVDKAHSEVLTFSMVAMACAWLRDKPWLSFICLGLAGAQNPPIAPLVPLAAAAAIVLTGTRELRTARFWGFLGLGLGLAALHPLYYYVRLGITTPLVDPAQTPRLPTLQEAGAVLWDPNIGLFVHVPWWPLLVLCCAIAVAVRRPRALVNAAVLFTVIAAGVFLFAFSQATNINSGGTPGPSRYVVWLLPLVIPIVCLARDISVESAARPAGRPGGFNLVLVALAIASSAWALAFFRPSIPERVMRPTALARYLWNRYPAVHDPVPEIFAEMVLGAERVELPITADHCTKVLLHEGRWPLPCVPQPVPPECETRNQLCYANRSVAEYSFSRVSTSLPPVAVPGEAWTPGQAAVFRTRLSSLPWWTLRWRRSGTGDSAVRAIDGVRRSWVMQAHGLLVVVGREVGSDASLVLRTPVPVQATITDLETGASVSAIEEEDSRTDPWRLAVPGPRPMVLVVMTAR